MGACATKPKTLEGKAPEEEAAAVVLPIEASKVAPEMTTTMASTEPVAANQAPDHDQKLAAEEAKAEPAAAAEEEAELLIDVVVVVQKDEAAATPEQANIKEEEVEEKIVEEEKPSAPVEEKTAAEVGSSADVVEETREVKNAEVVMAVAEGTTEVIKNAEEEKPVQS